ncbi:RNA polymerase sigma factor [Breoghania sp. L-A4]|nr:RNA polymerase sigma factor [Breoghania sp. L-A4]
MRADDNALARRAADGDGEAFQHLLERHYDTVYRLAYRFTGVRPDAEDLAQDICIALPAKLRSFKGEARFTTWLYRVVVNAARDRHRSGVNAARAHRAYGEMAELARGEATQAARELAWLYDALERIGGDLRETAILVLAEDLSHAQAAEILMVKESTVSWRMHELRKKLKALVDA